MDFKYSNIKLDLNKMFKQQERKTLMKKYDKYAQKY